MNTISYFEIQASNPSTLVTFYKNVFGWNFVRDTNIPIEYYRLTGGATMGAILARPQKTPPIGYGTNAFVCSIQVSNFDETSKKIIENGGIVALAKFAIPAKCWQGYFLDSDNNTFGIYEVDQAAK